MKKFRLPKIQWNPRFSISSTRGHEPIWIITIGSREFYLSHHQHEYERNGLRFLLTHAPHKEWKKFTLWWKTPPFLAPAEKEKPGWLNPIPQQFPLGVAMILAKRKAVADALHEEREAGL